MFGASRVLSEPLQLSRILTIFSSILCGEKIHITGLNIY